MADFITTRQIRLIGRDVAEGEIISTPKDLDLDHAGRLLALGYIAEASELPEGTGTVEIASLTAPQLKEMAAAEGIDLGDAKTKAAIVEAIEKARAADAAGA